MHTGIETILGALQSLLGVFVSRAGPVAGGKGARQAADGVRLR